MWVICSLDQAAMLLASLTSVQIQGQKGSHKVTVKKSNTDEYSQITEAQSEISVEVYAGGELCVQHQRTSGRQS